MSTSITYRIDPTIAGYRVLVFRGRQFVAMARFSVPQREWLRGDSYSRIDAQAYDKAQEWARSWK